MSSRTLNFKQNLLILVDYREKMSPRRDPPVKVNFQLRVDFTPVFSATCPFFSDVHHSQIEHFKQAVVSGEHRFVFTDFSELPVEPLNGICSINQRPDFFGIFEIR